jgi:hypothetical protein
VFKKLCSVALACGATSTALADSYLNVGVSMNTVKAEMESAHSFTTNHDEDSNTAYFDFGYFLTDNISAEIGYRSAEHTERYSFNGDGFELDGDVSVLKVGVKVFTSTQEDFYGFGGLGLAMMETELTTTDAAADPTVSVGDKFKSDANNVYFTLGAGYSFTEALSGEIAYANYGKAGDPSSDGSETSEQKYTELSIGISYRF